MKLTLYGVRLSSPVRSVLLTAEELALDFHWKEISVLDGDHTDPDFVKKNPQHTIPTLEDDGKIIWDSHAIIAYLVAKFAKNDSLYPKDLYQRALVDQRLHFDSGVLFPAMKGIYTEIYYGRPYESKIDAMLEGYDLMEKFLESNKYLVGTHLTIADFSCIATITSIQGVVPVDKEKYPNLFSWMKRLAKLPYYHEANAIGAAELIEYFQHKIELMSKV